MQPGASSPPPRRCSPWPSPPEPRRLRHHRPGSGRKAEAGAAPPAGYILSVPEDLYTYDFVLWSERQAEALRRMRAGERVNDLDWDNVIEKVEGLGRSETKAVRTLLVRAIEHLLKQPLGRISGRAGMASRGRRVPARRPGRLDALHGPAPGCPAHPRAGAAQRARPRLPGRIAGPAAEVFPLSLPDLLPEDEAAAIDTAALAGRLRRGG